MSADMSNLRNRNDGYGAIAVVLHWTMAILIIALLMIGLYMTGLPASLRKIKFYGWHKGLGLLVLGLMAIRLVWRLSNKVPLLASFIPRWEVIAARGVHWAFYMLMAALPLSGWMMSSTGGISVSFFGLFVMPNLVAPNKQWHGWFVQTHHILAYTMIVLICIHVAAALKHHFINQDDVLRRMLPW